ncbi:SYNB protein, partial [Crocuta crocuta]
GLLFVCGSDAYLCLPANWMGICTMVFITPLINIVPNNQSLILPLAAYTRSKRAIQVIPLLTALGIMAEVGTRRGGIVSSTTYYQELSKDITDDIERVTESPMVLQYQVDSLAAVVLQNRRLDLRTAERGGLCLFLNEECCFCVNQSGIVQDMAQQLGERINKQRQELADSRNSRSNIRCWAPWLLPLAGPLLMLFIALLFGSCILNVLTRLVSSRLEAIKLQM